MPRESFWISKRRADWGTMDVAERETRVRNFVEEVWNGRNYEAADDLYGENYVNPFGTGPSARVEPIRRYHHAFPDLHLSVEELHVAGDTVVLKGTLRGTDTGGHLGRPPTGRAIEDWVVLLRDCAQPMREGFTAFPRQSHPSSVGVVVAIFFQTEINEPAQRNPSHEHIARSVRRSRPSLTSFLGSPAAAG